MQLATDSAPRWGWVFAAAILAACTRTVVEPTEPPPAVHVPAAATASAARPAAAASLDGFLETPVAQRRCGTEICSGDQSCCGQPPSCQPDDSCPDPVGRYDCARPGDCVDGHTCVVESSTSGCTAYVPSIVVPGVVDPFLGIPIACETASDCPADTCPHKAPARCGPGNQTWINVCLCP